MIPDLIEALGPGHLIAEAITEVASYLIFGLLIGRWVLRRHDRKVHQPEPLTEEQVQQLLRRLEPLEHHHRRKS